MVVRVCDIKFLNPDGTLEQVRFPDFLEDAREGSPKLSGYRGNLPIYSFINTMHSSVCFLRKVEDKARSAMCLRYFRNVGEIELHSKHPHCIHCGEEDDKAFLYPPLHLPPDKPEHFRGACRGAVSNAWLDHGSPVLTGMLFSTL